MSKDGKSEWLSGEARNLIEERSEEGENTSETIIRVLKKYDDSVDWSDLPSDVLSEDEIKDLVDDRIREASRGR